MIDHKRKFIFIHIPKAGGTSVEAALELKGGPQHVPFKFHPNKNEYFSFTIIRNIFDKAVSWYLFHKKNYPKLNEYQTKDFNEWVRLGMKTHSAYTLVKNPLSDLDFLEDSDNKVKLNFIGRFGNFQEDFDIICGKIGIPQQKLPHKNKSEHKHYTEYYDDETRDIVAKRYAKDIEYFGYKFGE